MKYNIITINDDRKVYKDLIRERVEGHEIFVPAVDGNKVDLDEQLTMRGLRLNGWNPTRGELGVWLSTFDCWWAAQQTNEPILVFEDDATPTTEFNALFNDFVSELPEDWHYLSLWVPENQYYDYLYDVEYDGDGRWEKIGPDRNAFTSIHNFGAMRLSRVYQGYGNVATFYSVDGAVKLLNHALLYGITGPIDCWIHDRAHTGIVNGFAPKPHWAKAVTYDWAAETTVHNTERVL